jgi:hypothetical protein
MITHIVLFRWKPQVPEEKIGQIIFELRQLPEQIPFIKALTVGQNFSPFSDGYTHALVVTLPDKKSLRDYRNHPLHAAIAESIAVLEEKSIGIDFES